MSDLLHPTEKEIIEKIAEDMDMLLTESQRLGLTILRDLGKKESQSYDGGTAICETIHYGHDV